MVAVGLREYRKSGGRQRIPQAGKEGMPEIVRRHSRDVNGAITAVVNRQRMKSI